MIGEIKLVLEGATFEDTERCRHIIHSLFTSGVFGLKNSEVTLNFDQEGQLGVIKISSFVRPPKTSPLQKVIENAKLEVISRP